MNMFGRRGRRKGTKVPSEAPSDETCHCQVNLRSDKSLNLTSATTQHASNTSFAYFKSPAVKVDQVHSITISSPTHPEPITLSIEPSQLQYQHTRVHKQVFHEYHASQYMYKVILRCKRPNHIYQIVFQHNK